MIYCYYARSCDLSTTGFLHGFTIYYSELCLPIFLGVDPPDVFRVYCTSTHEGGLITGGVWLFVYGH